jgi:hypothetical protein
LGKNGLSNCRLEREKTSNLTAVHNPLHGIKLRRVLNFEGCAPICPD